MSVVITLNFATAAEAAAALGRMAGPITEAEAALRQPVATKDAATPKPSAEKTATKPAAAAETAKPAATKPSADTGKTDAPAKGEEQAAKPLEYEVLQKSVFKLAGMDKAQIPPLLAKFGVTHFKEVPAEQRAEALAAVDAVIATLGAAA